MKTRTEKILEVAFLLALALVYVVFAVRRVDVSAFKHANFGLDRLPIKGSASFYRCSESGDSLQEGRPVIICLGNKLDTPDVLTQFVGRLGEPVTLIWCDLLSNLGDDTQLDDPVVWDKKRREFMRLFSRYREILRFDERRVYLTGSGFAGAYAWMLAYDQPGQYAGVVAVSAPSYPKPIQERIAAAKNVVTIAVFREQQEWLVKHRAEEERTGRLIESQNPLSKFSIKSMKGRAELTKCWVENMRYALRFRTATSREDLWKEDLDYFAREPPVRWGTAATKRKIEVKPSWLGPGGLPSVGLTTTGPTVGKSSRRPDVGLYWVENDRPEWTQWVCRHFRTNPIVQVELGGVAFQASGRREIPYKMSLKNHTALEGVLPFEWRPNSGQWEGIGGLDWHLQNDQ